MMRPLDFARLVRLPNVFTAWADIALGALATASLPDRALPFALLLLSSTALYWAGMVWNDYFDVAQDKRERPFRPIASGRVSTGAAFRLGTTLLLLGVAFAGLADWQGGELVWRSLPWALGLAVAILLYDGALKKTPIAPIVMGTCRGLNVLLGLSVAAKPIAPWGFALALVVGIYITGVTWFARTEASVSRKSLLMLGAGWIFAALGLALLVPPLAQHDVADLRPSPLFPYLLAVFGFYIGIPLVRAIRQPTPPNVQKGVKRAILGLILLDAILATALAGIIGLSVALLLLPAYFVGRWLYST